MAFNEDSSASGHDEPWIQWFCGLKGHEMFCEVERSYIEDGFNLYGLRACVSNFSDCLDLILDRIGPDDSDDSHLTQSACTLYGLIHARYIITAHGLDAMYNKYAAKDFGTCPLVQCGGQPVLPVGLKDEMGSDSIKIFCPKCHQVYHPPPVRSRAGNASGVDGAAFGTTFPHLFLMTFSNLVPDPLPVESAYVPRVFGFRVHKSTRPQPRASAVAASSPSLPGSTQPVSTSAAATTTPQPPPPQQPPQEPPAPVTATAVAPPSHEAPPQSPKPDAEATASSPATAQQQPDATTKPAAPDEDRTPPRPDANKGEGVADAAAEDALAASSTQKSAPPVPETDGILAQKGTTENEPDGLRDEEDSSKQLSPQAATAAAAGRSSSRKRREIGNGGGGGGSSSQSSNLNASAIDGKGTPSFLAENSVKRRRRNNNGSVS